MIASGRGERLRHVRDEWTGARLTACGNVRIAGTEPMGAGKGDDPWMGRRPPAAFRYSAASDSPSPICSICAPLFARAKPRSGFWPMGSALSRAV